MKAGHSGGGRDEVSLIGTEKLIFDSIKLIAVNITHSRCCFLHHSMTRMPLDRLLRRIHGCSQNVRWCIYSTFLLASLQDRSSEVIIGEFYVHLTCR